MNENLHNEVIRAKKARRRRGRRKGVLAAVSAIVILSTAYALIFPALTMQRKPDCGLEAHTHSPQCYAQQRVLTCEIEEGAGHIHGDACYTYERSVQCGLEETSAHTHTEECYLSEQVLICTQEHAHTDGCYETAGTLICSQPETAGHTHDDGCYETKQVLTCTQEETPAHTHSDACYQVQETPVCGKCEHTHTDACYQGSGQSDLETAAQWEASFAGAELTGVWEQDVISIAETQLGYNESTRNYEVLDAENGIVNGYTRYGDWYGIPYGDWCAMFVSFCLHYAGVDDTLFPTECGCGRWVELLSEKGRFELAQAYLPKAGDVIFYDYDSYDDPAQRRADHVGLVSEVSEETGKVRTIEGNTSAGVAQRQYDLTDPVILGYGVLPKNPEMEEEVFSLTATAENGIRVTVSGPLSALPFPPSQIELHAAAIEGEEQLQPLREIAEDTSSLLSGHIFMDISLVHDGEEVEPTGPVTVTFSADTGVTHVFHVDTENSDLVDMDAKAQEDGSVVIDTDHFSVYLLAAVEEEEISGVFYQRVSSITPNSTDQYLIVSVDGNYALTCTTAASRSTKVVLNQIKGNPDYYAVDNVSNTMLWTIRSGNYIRNVGATNYRLAMTSNLTFFSENNQALTRTFSAATGAWTIANGNYYLYNTDGNFSRSNSATAGSLSRRNVLILKRTETTLIIPGDPGSGGGGDDPVEPRPDDPIYIHPSGEITGAVADFGGRKDLTMAYASDPATSYIEQMLSQSREENGRILTDKSVVYGKDDYDGFSEYADDEFSVTLSAVAQQYEIISTEREATPIDVVLVVDVSGSMTNTVGGEKRAQTVVTATNTLIERIMRYHPANRIGIVTYSSGSADFLPISRYYVGGENTQPVYEKQEPYAYLIYNNSADSIQTNANLRDAGTRQRISGSVSVSGGTYTQHGLARGAAMFGRVTDTTFLASDGTEICRTPLMMLLSDGDPTHCTSNYMDVLSGPHYGSGSYPDAQNNQGVQGYYTILSANYYKWQIGCHYGRPAKVYTIGMGIYATGIADASGKSATGDHYKRAVLNPDAENIAGLLQGGSNHATTTDQLYSLLQGSFAQPYVTVDSTGSYNALGRTGTNVPVIPNPYASDYSYADGAYFKEDYDPQALIDVFDSIVIESMDVYESVTSFTETTDLTIEDTLGDGMQVNSPPILRFAGVNYEPVSVQTEGDSIRYAFSGMVSASHYAEDVDLGITEITVSGTPGKGQKILWSIPGELVPELAHAHTADFYYPELPIRLIFRVGLTDEAKASAAHLHSSESVSFYTNSQENPTTAIFYPRDHNPYYQSNRSMIFEKDSNPTQTRSTCYESLHKEYGEHTILKTIHGNNGRLIFAAGDSISVSVKKEWDSSVSEKRPVTVALYSSDGASVQSVLHPDGTPMELVLNEENEWSGSFDGLDAELTYYVAELHTDGYRVSYAGGTTQIIFVDGKQIRAVKAEGQELSITITNALAVTLPETGGIGTEHFVCAGAVLSLLAGAALWKRKRGWNKS